MSDKTAYRLDGFEADNLLAFLALLGTLRVLELLDAEQEPSRRLGARAAWTIDEPPLRPALVVNGSPSRDEVAQRVSEGLMAIAADFDFGGRQGLDYSGAEARALLDDVARRATAAHRRRADVVAAMMTDAAIKDPKDSIVEATPLCLMFGQGHQHFLERVAEVPNMTNVAARGRAKKPIAATDAIAATLFAPWARADATPSFRWDPEEDVRYALMAGNPTSPEWKLGTEHAANRLAVAALPMLPSVPVPRGARVRPIIPGGAFGSQGFSFAWPIWRGTATLAAIRAVLTHPRLRKPGELAHLGVAHVVEARRISVGKFMNFTRARPLAAPSAAVRTAAL
jgi:hypothetical protein